MSLKTLNPTPHVLTLTSYSKAYNDKTIDVSRGAQIGVIEASFAYQEEPFDLSKVKHPTKAGVEAVESYEVLPDVDIWANAYDLFKFAERPGERQHDVPDPRLDCAILRPMEADGDHFLAYYLPKEDEAAENFKALRRQGENVEDALFSFVRDYETVKIEQDVPNEFLLVLDDGEDVDNDPFGESTKEKRGKGAYYKNIERKIMLKKKRANVSFFSSITSHLVINAKTDHYYFTLTSNGTISPTQINGTVSTSPWNHSKKTKQTNAKKLQQRLQIRCTCSIVLT